MFLIVGLGNPGKKYQNNRHNVGFMAIDAIANCHKLEQQSSQYKADVYKGSIGGSKVIAIKPMTFMNDSGKSVSGFANFFKIPPENILVIHDELDLDLGRVKLNIGSGTAGHNGLKSINTMIANKYMKLRIGIGHPQSRELVTGYVLEDFTKDENVVIQEILSKVSGLIVHIMEGKIDIFSSEINQIR